MTLLHELAHILFDRTHDTLFSPDREFLRKPTPAWTWRLFGGFGDVEVHADAFAACFLAPAEGVRQAVGDRAPSSEPAIHAVGATFGIGRIAAVNRLCDVYGLPPEVRDAMSGRRARRYPADFAADSVEPNRIGLRPAFLMELVGDALRRKLIGRARAWECLDVPFSEALPIEGLPEALTAPLVSAEGRVRRAASRLLRSAHPDRSLHPGAVADDPRGWRVEVLEGGIGDRELSPAGCLVLDLEGVLLADGVTPESSRGD
jgi:hypothetical protein